MVSDRQVDEGKNMVTASHRHFYTHRSSRNHLSKIRDNTCNTSVSVLTVSGHMSSVLDLLDLLDQTKDTVDVNRHVEKDAATS